MAIRRTYEAVASRPLESALATNKVLRNTYLLLSVTLLFSALMAGLSMAIQVPFGGYLASTLVAFGLLWFVLPRTANSAAGIGVVFAVTGLLGFGLGPVLNTYLHMPNGAQTVMTAMGMTGGIFVALSAYAIVTRKDFSFMGGMLSAGILVAFIGSLIAFGAALFGYPLPMLSLAVSAMFALLMSGLILFETGNIINGGETNYILATVSLYIAIYNLFLSLLQLLGVVGGDD